MPLFDTLIPGQTDHIQGWTIVAGGDGLVEVDVRAGSSGRITHAIRTSPGRPATAAPGAGRSGTAKAWLTKAPVTIEQPIRFTRVRRGVTGGFKLVTHDACHRCGGPITNNAITRIAAGDTGTWVHLHHSDWADNIHPAEPAGGPVTADDDLHRQALDVVSDVQDGLTPRKALQLNGFTLTAAKDSDHALH